MDLGALLGALVGGLLGVGGTVIGANGNNRRQDRIRRQDACLAAVSDFAEKSTVVEGLHYRRARAVGIEERATRQADCQMALNALYGSSSRLRLLAPSLDVEIENVFDSERAMRRMADNGLLVGMTDEWRALRTVHRASVAAVVMKARPLIGW